MNKTATLCAWLCRTQIECCLDCVQLFIAWSSGLDVLTFISQVLVKPCAHTEAAVYRSQFCRVKPHASRSFLWDVCRALDSQTGIYSRSMACCVPSYLRETLICWLFNRICCKEISKLFWTIMYTLKLAIGHPSNFVWVRGVTHPHRFDSVCKFESLMSSEGVIQLHLREISVGAGVIDK